MQHLAGELAAADLSGGGVADYAARDLVAVQADGAVVEAVLDDGGVACDDGGYAAVAGRVLVAGQAHHVHVGDAAADLGAVAVADDGGHEVGAGDGAALHGDVLGDGGVDGEAEHAAVVAAGEAAAGHVGACHLDVVDVRGAVSGHGAYV